MLPLKKNLSCFGLTVASARGTIPCIYLPNSINGEPITGPSMQNSLPAAPTDPAARVGAAFLASLGDDAALFSLGSSVSKIIQIASDGDEATSELTYFVLADVALTQNILRLANTSLYRSRSGTPITTISRAIFVLGFETVRLSALGLMLVEGMSNKRQARNVARELSLALRASIIARKLAGSGPFKGDEDVAIAALFKNFGALLLASHDHALYERVRQLVESGAATLPQACRETLGHTFDSLAAAALQRWSMPAAILHAATRPAPKLGTPAANHRDWQQQAAAFSFEAAKLLPAFDPATAPEHFGQELLAQFGHALGLERPQLRALFESSRKEAHALETGFDAGTLEDLSTQVLAAQHEAGGEAAAGSAQERSGQDDSRQDGSGLDELMMHAPAAEASSQPARHASGKPLNAGELLLAGAQDATAIAATGHAKPGELILFILETLHNSMGFRFSTVCIKDPKLDTYRSRLSLGADHIRLQQGFQFAPARTDAAHDLFQLALDREADLTISDASAPKIRGLLPAWHKTLLPDAASFIILPLVFQKKAVGFFYADRTLPAPEGVTPEEVALLRMLKSQAIAALRPR
jgi:HD-like signal output (HDOD) protein